MSAYNPAVRLASAAGAVLAVLVGAGEAHAQDPFGMLEAHSAMSAQAQYAASLHSRYSNDDDDDDRPRDIPPPPRRLSPEERAVLVAEAAEREAEEAAAYERWRNGAWQFFQSRDPADPGEFCAAMYQNSQGMITLTGLDETWDGALLMFTGENVPTPRRFREVTATLTQTGDAPANVRAFNYANDPAGMYGLGTLAFAVPNMSAALDGIADEQEFAISIGRREVFRMSWKDGLSAVQAMRECLGRR